MRYQLSTRLKYAAVGFAVGLCVGSVGLYLLTRPVTLRCSPVFGPAPRSVLTAAPVEILKASGGIVQHNVAAAEWNVKGKPIWAVLSPYHVGLCFLGRDKKEAVVYYLPGTNKYRIVGSVQICYPDGTTALAADTEINAPGPPQHPRGDRLTELASCERRAL